MDKVPLQLPSAHLHVPCPPPFLAANFVKGNSWQPALRSALAGEDRDFPGLFPAAHSTPGRAFTGSLRLPHTATLASTQKAARGRPSVQSYILKKYLMRGRGSGRGHKGTTICWITLQVSKLGAGHLSQLSHVGGLSHHLCLPGFALAGS